MRPYGIGHYGEGNAIQKAMRLDDQMIERITELHYRWMLDSEIGEELGMSSLTVWHARTYHGINRHSSP